MTDIYAECATYLFCIYCEEVGVVYYPVEKHIVITGTSSTTSNMYIGTTTCNDCRTELLHNDGISSYVRSTWIYHEIHRVYNVRPAIISINRALVCIDIDEFMNQLTSECSIYSILYKINGLIEVNPRRSFYGRLPK